MSLSNNIREFVIDSLRNFYNKMPFKSISLNGRKIRPDSSGNSDIEIDILPLEVGKGIDSLQRKEANTSAAGDYSFADGTYTYAIGDNSHTEGEGFIEGYEISSVNEEDSSCWYQYVYDVGMNIIKDTVVCYSDSSTNTDTYAYVVDSKFGDYHYLKFKTNIPLSNSPLLNAYVFCIDSAAMGKASHIEGYCNKAIGNYSHAEGEGARALGERSHAEGSYSKAAGWASHAEGLETNAFGYAAHAEGEGSHAESGCSHAEGRYCHTKADYSHAEGVSSVTEEYAEGSHAEGAYSCAEGAYSHAEGMGTTTTNEAEHAQGIYNISRPNTLFSIGIGHYYGEGSIGVVRQNIIEVCNNKLYINDVGNYDGSTLTNDTVSIDTVLSFTPYTEAEYAYIFDLPAPPTPVDLTNYRIFIDDYPAGVDSYAEDYGYSDAASYIAAQISAVEQEPYRGALNTFEYQEDIIIDDTTYQLWAFKIKVNGEVVVNGTAILKPDITDDIFTQTMEADVENAYCPFIKVTMGSTEYTDDNSNLDEKYRLVALREITD